MCQCLTSCQSRQIPAYQVAFIQTLSSRWSHLSPCMLLLKAMMDRLLEFFLFLSMIIQEAVTLVFFFLFSLCYVFAKTTDCLLKDLIIHLLLCSFPISKRFLNDKDMFLNKKKVWLFFQSLRNAKLVKSFETRQLYQKMKQHSGMFLKGEQNLPPQNMLLWHKDYFRLIIFKKQQAQEKLSKLRSYPFCRRYLHLEGKSSSVRFLPLRTRQRRMTKH